MQFDHLSPQVYGQGGWWPGWNRGRSSVMRTDARATPCMGVQTLPSAPFLRLKSAVVLPSQGTYPPVQALNSSRHPPAPTSMPCSIICSVWTRYCNTYFEHYVRLEPEHEKRVSQVQPPFWVRNAWEQEHPYPRGATGQLVAGAGAPRAVRIPGDRHTLGLPFPVLGRVPTKVQ